MHALGTETANSCNTKQKGQNSGKRCLCGTFSLCLRYLLKPNVSIKNITLDTHTRNKWDGLPWSLSRSDLFSSTSGLSALSTWFKHWLCKLLRVTVKLTNVTRLHRSGANSTYIYTNESLLILPQVKLWTRDNSSWVSIHNRAIAEYFPVVLLIMTYKVFLTFESVDEILKCDHSNESYWAVLSCGAVYYAVRGDSNLSLWTIS